MLKKGYSTPNKQKTMKDEDPKIKEEMLKTRKGAYLGCPFLMMADKRYKPVKKLLHVGHLAEKQQYSHDVLSTKRFMADFIGTSAGKPKRQQQHQPKSEPVSGPGVAFVSPDKKSKGPWPVCHTWGITHNRGREKCNTISKR